MSQRKAAFQHRGRRLQAAILLKTILLNPNLKVRSRPGKDPTPPKSLQCHPGRDSNPELVFGVARKDVGRSVELPSSTRIIHAFSKRRAGSTALTRFRSRPRAPQS